MFAPLVMVALLGCRGLDSVDIVAGEHCAPDREVEIACVLDGDTFQVGECGGESVRLLGVAAPEIAHNDSEVDECWGPESASWLT
ncbi:MAG: thermonuclease family protein, partial [Myxococcota bacterium]